MLKGDGCSFAHPPGGITGELAQTRQHLMTPGRVDRSTRPAGHDAAQHHKFTGSIDLQRFLLARSMLYNAPDIFPTSAQRFRQEASDIIYQLQISALPRQVALFA